MNRRDFIKLVTAGTACLTPAAALAKIPTEHMQQIQQTVSNAMTQAAEFDLVSDEDIEWTDGFSDGRTCTFGDLT